MSKRLIKPLIRKWRAWRNFARTEVFVISFPKSGRTWLRVLIGKALCEMSSQDERLIFDESHVLESAAGAPWIDYIHDGAYPVKSQVDLIDGDRRRYRGKKVILLVRDPRDVAVSFCFEATRRRKLFEGTLSEFIRDPRYGIPRILRFYNVWRENQTVPKDFLLLRYEDIQADPEASLRQTLAFLGFPDLPPGLLERTVEFARFESMRKMEKSDFFKSKKMRARKDGDPETHKVRRGKVGGFVDYLDPEDIEYARRAAEKAGRPFYDIAQAAPAGMKSQWRHA
jgi:hypothetical protein